MVDWDETRQPASKAIVVAEPLHTFSIADLEARVTALDAEITRVRTEIEQRRRRSADADALFKR